MKLDEDLNDGFNEGLKLQKQIVDLRKGGASYRALSRRFKLPAHQVIDMCRNESLHEWRREYRHEIVEALRQVYG